MLTDLLTATLGELLADIQGTDIGRLREERAMQRAIATAAQCAEARFRTEYPAQDAALITVPKR
jgi:hypothetical protein